MKTYDKLTVGILGIQNGDDDKNYPALSVSPSLPQKTKHNETQSPLCRTLRNPV